MKSLAIALLALITVNSCGNYSEENTKTIIYHVNSTKVPCEGVGAMQCLQIKKGDTATDGNWTNFYGNINGFEFETGYTYKISVKEEQLDPAEVPADASTIKYTLVEVLEKKQDPTLRLHDIWSLQSLNGMSLQSDRYATPKQTPRLELFVAEKRLGGTDGCNNIFGSIETLTETEIRFSKLGGTKMMCPNMEVPDLFTTALSNTVSYKIEKLNLFFYNQDGEEVLQFVKVD